MGYSLSYLDKILLEINREFKHEVYGRQQRLPLIFYSFVVILK